VRGGEHARARVVGRARQRPRPLSAGRGRPLPASPSVSCFHPLLCKESRREEKAEGKIARALSSSWQSGEVVEDTRFKLRPTAAMTSSR